MKTKIQGPILEGYELRGINGYVDRCMPSLSNKSLREQFLFCRIRTIWTRPLLGNGLMSVLHHKWCIYLKNDNPLEDWSFTVAHELGHTFQFVYRNNTFKDLWKWWPYGTEAFANSFARRWLKLEDNKQQLEDFLVEHLHNRPSGYKHHTVNVENLSHESF